MRRNVPSLVYDSVFDYLPMIKDRTSIQLPKPNAVSSVVSPSASYSIDWQALYEQEHRLCISLEQQNRILKIKYQRTIEQKYGKTFVCHKCETEREPDTLESLKS